MSEIIGGVVTIVTAIIGVALLAVLVSKNSDTAGVIKAGSSGVSSMIGAAVSPVTGSSFGMYGGF